MKARFFFFVHFVSPCSWILPVCPNTVNFPSLPTLASVSSVRRFVITVRGLLPGKHSSCLCFKNPAYRSTGCSTHVGFICERNSLLGLEYPFYPFDSTFVKKMITFEVISLSGQLIYSIVSQITQALLNVTLKGRAGLGGLLDSF